MRYTTVLQSLYIECDPWKIASASVELFWSILATSPLENPRRRNAPCSVPF